MNCSETSQPPASSDLDIFILAGQSNMAGRGHIVPEENVAHPRILSVDSRGQWISRCEPIHFDKPEAGAGLAWTFARHFVEQYPSRRIGLIPCAVGGSSIDRWMPGGDCFETAIGRSIPAQNAGILRGILWHQGETDAMTQERSTCYLGKLVAALRNLRVRLNATRIPIILGELGPFLQEREDWDYSFVWEINSQIRRFCATEDNSAVATAEGTHSTGDQLHFDADSLKTMGERYYKCFQNLSLFDNPGTD